MVDLSKVGFDQNDLVRSIFNESLWHAFCYSWPTINQEALVRSFYLKLLADEIQEVLERVIAGQPKKYDLIINVPPGSGKSSLMAITKAWLFARMPRVRILYASYAHALAIRLNVKTRDILRSDWYKAAFPEVAIRDDMDTKTLFQTTAGGESLAAGVDGTITGFHGHVLFWDDLLNPRESVSDAALDAVQLFDEETFPSRALNKLTVPIIGVMQRLHQRDSTGRAIERAKRDSAVPLRLICLPADGDEFPVIPPKAKDYYQDGLLDPLRFPRTVLDSIKAVNPVSYAGQYGQQPVPREGGMFNVERLRIIHSAPPKLSRVVRYWDKAGSKRKKSAYTVGVKMGVYEWQQVISGVNVTSRKYYVLDVVRFQERAGERERIIHQTAVADGPGVSVWIEQEPGSGGLDSAEMTISNLAGFSVRAEIPSEDKVARADGFASQVDIFNVSLVFAGWNEAYVQELRYFPNGSWKDQVDASSGAFRQLSHSTIAWGAI